jgi:hypothetical protein
MKRSLLYIFLLSQHYLLGQTVGVNTSTPDPSAALDISSNNKGLLIPKVQLQNLSDNLYGNPAKGLLLYNSNFKIGNGAGYYYNSNTPEAPAWTGLNDWQLPFYDAASASNALFRIKDNSGDGIAIHGYGANNGIGVYAKSSSGKALDVNGWINIVGNGQSQGVGKILTSDGEGNATWQGAISFGAFGVKGGGSQKIAKNIWSKVPFGNENFDLQGNYNNADQSPHSTFIAPVEGIYDFDVQIIWDYFIDVDVFFKTRIRLVLDRNGVESLLSESNTVRKTTLTGGGQIRLNTKLLAGDKVFVQVYQSEYDYLDLQTENIHCHFTGNLSVKL